MNVQAQEGSHHSLPSIQPGERTEQNIQVQDNAVCSMEG